MRKTILNVLFLTSLSIFFLLPFYKVFTVEFVDGHDFQLHFHMIHVLEKYIKAGIFLPRWLSEATYGYGSPIFTFMWGVPYYLGAFLHIFGFNYSQVFKILIIFPNILSGIGLYFWSKSKYGRFIGTVCAIIYVFVPYRFLDSFIRCAIGELFFFAFFPFILYFIDHAKNKYMIIFGSLFSALLIYSHQGLSLIGYPLLIAYILFQYSQNNKITLLRNQIFILIGGLILTSFYWFPIILYQHLLPIAEGKAKSISFPPLLSLIRSKWEGGSVYDGRRLIMSFQIGLAQLGIIFIAHLCALYYIVKKNKQSLIFLFWLSIFWLSIFFMQPVSKWLWIKIPLIINLQFPWRLLFIPMFVSATLSGLILSKLNTIFRYILGFIFVLVVIFTNRNHLGVLNKEINFQEFFSYQGTYDVGGEKLPKYVYLKEIEQEFKKNGIGSEFFIVSGKGTIVSQERKDYQSVAEISMETDGKVHIRRIYFPGWKAYQNGKEITQFEKGNGIFLAISKGQSTTKVEYKDPPIVIVSNIISLISIGILSIFLLIK